MKKQLTVKNIRNLNKINILKTIIKYRSILRSDISKYNDISVMTVKNVLEDLLQSGIVIEQTFDTAIGRKPRLLQLSENIDYIVCINLTSRDFFYYVIYNIYGDIAEKRYIKFDMDHDYLANLHMLVDYIQEDLKKFNKKAFGIGLAVPGAYFEEKDRINHDLIPEFADIGIKQLFSDAFQTKNVIVGHDVCMAALAESRKIEQNESLFYFYIGDGVGGAFVHNDELYQGADSVAGEVGQMIVPGKYGDSNLESLVSIPSILNRLHAVSPNLSFFNALNMYKENDSVITPIMDNVFEILSRIIYNLVWVLNPKTFIVWSSYKEFSNLVSAKAIEFGSRLKNLPITATLEIKQPFWEEHSALRGLFDMLSDIWVNEI